MWWKLYFWFVVILLTSALIGVLLPNESIKFTLLDWVLLFLSIPSLVGLFAFAYKKQMLNQKAWGYVFWLTISIDAVSLFLYSIQQSDFIPALLKPGTGSSLIESIINFLFELPVLFALYQLAFNSDWNVISEGSKKLVSLINPQKMVWWQIGAISLLVNGFFNVAGPAFNPNTVWAINVGIAIGGILNLILGILIWFRVNIALCLAAFFYIYAATVNLITLRFGYFFIDAIVLSLLFVLILKTRIKT